MRYFADIAGRMFRHPPHPHHLLPKLLIASILLSLPGICDAGRIRSYKAKAEFKRQHPCPATNSSRGKCPGFVIDHIKALACGGADAPENMQWQTIDEGKQKDSWERVNCSRPVISQ
jgi:hypothetical protein